MIRKVNEILGYAFWVLGVSKILLVGLILLQLGTNLSAIFNGGEANSEYFPELIAVVKILEIGLLIGSIVMIFINLKRQPEAVKGYLWGLGAILLEFILSSFMMVFALFAQCSMFIKAGSKIRNINADYEMQGRTSKKMIKNTEWFYSNENLEDNKNDLKQDKKKTKIQEEIKGWKQLFDEGQIDEQTYNQEVSRLEGKLRKII